MSEDLLKRYFTPVKGLSERVGIGVDLDGVCMYATHDGVAGESAGEFYTRGRNSGNRVKIV